MNESGCGHVMESSDIFSTDRPWYNIKKYQRVLLAGEWFSSKKLPKFRQPVQSRSLVEASNRIETSTKSGNTTISGKNYIPYNYIDFLINKIIELN